MLNCAPKWLIRPQNEAIVEEIASMTGVSHAVATAMANRGVTPDDVESYVSASHTLLPDPFLMLNMDKAAERLADAIQSKEKVAIWLDYDGDGQTAGALLCWFGRMLGAYFRPYIPDRLTEGYGLNSEGVRLLSSEDISLLVTVDCGISALDEAKLCADMGMDLIITDHHTPGDEIPLALAVVDPLLPGDHYPFNKIAGVGVAYNLALATMATLRNRRWFNSAKPEPTVEVLLPLVAIGTVADVVELQSVNRVLVTQGINRIRQGRHPFHGISALCRVAGVNETEVSSGQIGFRLAPRLNASGRMETAQIGFDLLMSADYVKSQELAEELDRLNTIRQEIEEKVVLQAVGMFESDPELWERKTIVLASQEWHPGVVGIAASRMIERYHRPTVLIALDGDQGKGSCRSIKPFHIYEGLRQCMEFLVGFGGHPMAAGLHIAADKISDFTDAFEQSAIHLTVEDLRPTVMVDAEIDINELDLGVCNEIEQMEPFGMGNNRPIFCMRQCKIEQAKILKGKHLKLLLVKDGKEYNAIGFNMASIPENDLVDVAFSVERNEWRGKVSLQLQLKALA